MNVFPFFEQAYIQEYSLSIESALSGSHHVTI